MNKFVTAVMLGVVSVSFAEAEELKPDCETLGYTQDVGACKAAGGLPLYCPYATVKSQKCICLSKSCRGYPLLKNAGGEGYYYLSDNGEKVAAMPSKGNFDDYVDGALEACVTGTQAESVTYYRIAKCKSNATYQNNICDEGCDTVNVYPFTVHPGTLPGKVRSCVNAEGEYWGYESCNDGWSLSNGRCLFNDCDVVTYPYIVNPNTAQNRGAILSCFIGSNAYYKYSDKDKDGNVLNSGTCAQNGFTQANSVCYDTCEINVAKCTKTAKDGYVKWRCPLAKSTCRVGDYATINGTKIGVIVHLPSADDDRTLVIADKQYNKAWQIGNSEDLKDLPNVPNRGMDDALNISDSNNGQYYTALIMAYKQAHPEVSLPLAETVNSYVPEVCISVEMCQKGQWFLPVLGELQYMFANRYILHNVLGDTALLNGRFSTASETSYRFVWNINFNDGTMQNNYGKNVGSYMYPMLAF